MAGKNRINVGKAIQFLREGAGMEAKEFNYYQIRIRHEESRAIYDWYHTTGAIVACEDSQFRRIGTATNPEVAAEKIKNYIYQ